MISLIVYSALLVESGLATPLQRVCPSGQYLDQGKGTCEHCEQICVHAAIQQTTDLCLRHCPGFMFQGLKWEQTVSVKDHTELCPPHTYLDKVILRCEPCADICTTDHEISGACAQMCPDFSKPKSKFPFVQLLWAVSVALGIVLLAMLSMITFRLCSGRCRHGGREDALIQPVCNGTPYIKIKGAAQKPEQSVERWLTYLDADDLQEDCHSNHSNRSSILDHREEPR
ncbi:uncharacterized protein LOC124262548 [Haliotis rubra]|uniref:uncharacterized protein LOC124262548 n=1 Tax=Haliotis rubra TaxID=36100 RepID=UPI001EE53331|nr:uncharacterized protein LOC124262548 [Haliotis rubra]